MSKNMDKLRTDYPDLYDCSVMLNDTVFNGKVLSKKELKLIAIALSVGLDNEVAIRKQMQNAICDYGITRDEIMDVLRMVLLMNGKPAFTKAVGILYSLTDSK